MNANVAAVRDVCAGAGGVDAALANHLVMGPAILARAGAAVGPFAAKVHGSALSYTVIPHRDRFLPYAREGMAAARAVLVGSRHTAESLWETVALDGLPEKTRLGPPGVDVEAFAPLPDGADPGATLTALATRLDAAEPGGLGRDLPAAAAAIRAYAGASGPRVVFVGKLIVSKGCDLLLAAWPLVVARHPGARLLMVGFGEYRDGLHRLARALAAGDLDGAREVARLGWALEGGEEAPLRRLAAFLAEPPAGYADAARAAAGTVDWAGRLEYGEVAEAVRASDAMVVPEHLPGGVRDGRRRGRGRRRAAGLCGPLRARRGRRDARRRAPAAARRPDDVPARPRPGRGDRRSPRPLAQPARRRASRGERRPDGHRARALELGARRRHRRRGLAGRPRRAAHGSRPLRGSPAITSAPCGGDDRAPLTQ